MSTLPSDLWQLIFSYELNSQTCLAIPRVCKLFNNLSSNHDYYERLFRKQFPEHNYHYNPTYSNKLDQYHKMRQISVIALKYVDKYPNTSYYVASFHMKDMALTKYLYKPECKSVHVDDIIAADWPTLLEKHYPYVPPVIGYFLHCSSWKDMSEHVNIIKFIARKWEEGELDKILPEAKPNFSMLKLLLNQIESNREIYIVQVMNLVTRDYVYNQLDEELEWLSNELGKSILEFLDGPSDTIDKIEMLEKLYIKLDTDLLHPYSYKEEEPKKLDDEEKKFIQLQHEINSTSEIKLLYFILPVFDRKRYIRYHKSLLARLIDLTIAKHKK